MRRNGWVVPESPRPCYTGTRERRSQKITLGPIQHSSIDRVLDVVRDLRGDRHQPAPVRPSLLSVSHVCAARIGADLWPRRAVGTAATPLAHACRDRTAFHRGRICRLVARHAPQCRAIGAPKLHTTGWTCPVFFLTPLTLPLRVAVTPACRNASRLATARVTPAVRPDPPHVSPVTSAGSASSRNRRRALRFSLRSGVSRGS